MSPTTRLAMLSCALLTACAAEVGGAASADESQQEAPDELVEASALPLTWSGCTTAQRAEVTAQMSVVRSILNSYAGHISADDEIYEEWFGTWTAARAAIVSSVFADMNADWDSWKIICDPSTSCIAHVWGSRPEIYLCPGWFAQPQQVAFEDHSSKVGVLIHELSHIATPNGTVDAVHPQCVSTCADPFEARLLADVAPDVAITNGENYEHFATQLFVSDLHSAILQ